MNLINGQEELWVETGNLSTDGRTSIAFSNCGRIRRKNGVVEYSKYRQLVRYKGKLVKLHRIISEHFIPKTEEDLRLNRNIIDHITHHPNGMNVNDIRNMRWCTQKENCNFDEARMNRSKAARREARMNRSKSTSKAMLNRPKSVFGQLYFSKYGYSKKHNVNQYCREYMYYLRNGELKMQ